MAHVRPDNPTPLAKDAFKVTCRNSAPASPDSSPKRSTCFDAGPDSSRRQKEPYCQSNSARIVSSAVRSACSSLVADVSAWIRVETASTS
ncbi:hypothetical protein GCM10009528_47630 [Kineococcus aurantiacus]